MPAEPHVIAVTGLAFEAGIAAGSGVVVLTGGAANQQAISSAVRPGCLGIISFGIAGGLTANLKAGVCIVARSVVTGNRRLDTDRAWSQHLLNATSGAVHADIVSVATPACSPSDKRALAQATGAAAVDMESFGAAAAALQHRLPFAALRVVADPAHRSLPPAALIERPTDGRTDLSAVWRSIVAQPSQLNGLFRLALDTQKARTGLVRARRLAGAGFGLLGMPRPEVSRAE